jgi:uncharacterized protein YfaS (alpha-2-macroglobulin family)
MASNADIKVGDDVVFSIAITDSESQAATNPDTVTFYFLNPSGVVTSYADSDVEVTNPSTGTYKITFAPNAQGTWTWGVVTTGPAHTESEKFSVNANPFV